MNGYAENIYNLIPRDEVKQEKQPKHQSKFSKTVKEEYSSNKHAHRTMGEANVSGIEPDTFLKKHTRETKAPAVNADNNYHKPKEHNRPPVPKANEAPPVMGIKTKKNFINQNAVENILSVPKKPQKNMVDTRGGDKFPLDPSGLEPLYVKKRDYGKVPDYLIQREEEIRKAQEEYDAYVKEMQRRGAMQQLTREERDTILYGLKRNWDDLHHQYQSLSVMTDTIPKRHKKEKIEGQMKQLERDIELLERHPIIYLAN